MAKVIDAQIAEPYVGIGELGDKGAQSWIGGNVVQHEASMGGIDSHVLRAVALTENIGRIL